MLTRVAGANVWVARAGAGVAPDLMIHCSLARHTALLPLVRARRQPAVLFDLPGHGQSADWTKGADFHAATTDIATKLLPDAPVHLVGHSFGGTVALRVALENPGRVRALTLIEPVLFAAARGTREHAAHEAEFAPFIAAVQAGERMRAAEMFRGIWGEGDWPDLPERIKAQLAKRIHLITLADPAIAEDNAGLLDAGRLEALDIPVTLVRGRETRPVVGAIHAALAARLPQARDHVIAGAGHMVPLTHASAVAAVMPD